MESTQFKCRQCGAEIEFDPAADALKCPYCNHVHPIPKSESEIQELDFRAHLSAVASEADTLQASTIKCGQCGANVTFDPGVTAGECPFCGTPTVAAATSQRLIKPRALLPFDVTRAQGRALFGKWIEGLWFAPGELKKFARSDTKLQGVYIPYWTYDCHATTWYSGQRGDDYWVTESYWTTVNGRRSRRTRRVRKTRWRSVSGTVWDRFNDVLVLASESLPREKALELEPWDLKNLTPYEDSYLSGFKAECYQVDLADGFEEAKGIMETRIRRTIKRDIGGDHQRISSLRSQHDDVTFKHILLPIWISSYRYRKRIFRFLVNARTGEVQGERPWSWAKITLAILGGAALIAAIAAAVVISRTS